MRSLHLAAPALLLLMAALAALPAGASPTWACTDGNEDMNNPAVCVGANVGGAGDTGPCYAIRMHAQWFVYCVTAGGATHVLPHLDVKILPP